MRGRLTAEIELRSVAFCEWLEANFALNPMDAGAITFKAQETFLLTAKKCPRTETVAKIPRGQRRSL